MSVRLGASLTILSLALLLSARAAAQSEDEAPARVAPPDEVDEGDEGEPADDEIAPAPVIVVPIEPPPPEPDPESPPPPLREPADVEGPLTPADDAGSDEDAEALGAAIRQRNDVEPWHIAFGTATGFSTYAMTILGYLTYADRYGFDGPPNRTGCAGPSPILGAEACLGPPLAHLIAVSTASTLFTVTFALSLFMPDPLGAENGEHGTMLTVHKSLRWALLALFVGQLVLGAVTANIDTDFGTQRDLATAHLALGTVTMFTMTTQGVLGSLMEW